MAATVQRTGQGPDRGTGQYSQDRERWWDDRQQRWFLTGPAADTLEIELEDYAGTSWLTSVLTTLGSQFGTGTYRFIGVAHSRDPRWPTYRVVGDTFVGARAFLADIPPQESWSPGMTESLSALRGDLADHGWILTGRGNEPWSYRYIRPCIDTQGVDQPLV